MSPKISLDPDKQAVFAKRLIVALPFALFAVILLRSPLGLSLWLDETLTAWITGAGLSEVMTRSVEYQGQSPLYFILVWWLRGILGSAEWVLRLPSLIAAFVSCLLLWRIARAKINPWIAPFAVVVLLSLDSFQVAAFSARSYSLALMFSLFSFLALERWIASGRMWRGLMYVLCALTTIYLHYLFALMIVIHLLMLAEQRKGNIKFAQLISIFALLASLLAPGVIHLFILIERANEIQFLGDPGIKTLLSDLFPMNVVVAVVAAVLIALITQKSFRVSNPIATMKTPFACIAWYVLPPLVFFVHAHLTEGSWYLSRYFVWYTPALALCVTALLCSFWSQSTQPNRAIHVAVLAAFMMFLLREADRQWTAEPWREAAEAANKYLKNNTGPVLVYSGLTESDEPSWIGQASKRDYLLAPFEYYQVSKPALALPSDPASYGDVVKTLLSSESTAMFVSAQKKRAGNSVSESWVQAIKGYGFESCEVALLKSSTGAVRAFVFFKSQDSAIKSEICGG